MRLKLIITAFLLSFLIFSSEAQIPELNTKILDYVKSQLGKKVNRGECWDLAYEALTQNNCEWDGQYNFGLKLNPKTDSIYAGDILQFNNVTLKYFKEGLLYKETLKKHTAIIYSVKGKDYFEIADQNNAHSGRKVGISELKLSTRTTGTISFFRPVPKSNR